MGILPEAVTMELYITLKLHLDEALDLRAYLIHIYKNTVMIQGAAADTDFMLSAWLVNYLGARVANLERRRPCTPQSLKMPISVARGLWKNWQVEVIPATLNRVLGGIDRELVDRGLVEG